MRLVIRTLVDGKEVLAGAIPGSALLAHLIAARPASPEPAAIYLDFSGIEVATASFLRESVLAFRDYCRSNASSIYPVGANLSDAVEEELTTLLVQRGDAMAICTISANSRADDARVIGFLDEKQKEALHLVIELGSTDAPTLARMRDTTDQVGPTAWNNRLAALARKSLLIGRPVGRSMQFTPVLGGMRYGP